MIKKRLSRDLIGPTRFYLGVGVGLTFSILLYVFFLYFREILRFGAFNSSSDLVLLTPEESFWYSLFFAAITVAAGFGVTIWTWFHGPQMRYGISGRRLNYISTYALFTSMGLLYVVSKGSTTIALVLYMMLGSQDQLNWLSDLPELLVLMPTLGFLNIWMPIRLAFRSGNWMMWSFVVWLSLSVVLTATISIDPSHVNALHEQRLAPYLEIVNAEMERARLRGVTMPQPAIETLKHNETTQSKKQMQNLKSRFSSRIAIRADSVVLELIVVKKSPVHSLRATGNYNDEESLWPLALPRDVFRQLEINRDSVTRSYLQEIIQEYDTIFNGPEPGDLIEERFWRKIENRDFMRRNFRRIGSEFDSLKSVTIFKP